MRLTTAWRRPCAASTAFAPVVMLIACAGSTNGTSAAADASQQPFPSRTTMTAQTPRTPARSLIVSRPTEGRLGTLTFDDRNRVSLNTEGSGPAVDALKQAWKEISAKPKATWVKTVVEESGGKKVTAIEAEDYGPTEPNYFYAVLDTLSRQYGFSVDIAK
jgi:hypothetical protein